MKHILTLLILLTAGHAFADDRVQEFLTGLQAEARVDDQMLRIYLKQDAEQREQSTWIAAEKNGLRGDDFRYSPGGFLKSAEQICHLGVEDFSCYPNPALSYTATERAQKIIACLVQTCDAASDFSEARLRN